MMELRVGDRIALPRFAPYPRYGRVVALDNDGSVRVTDVQCGDPRCAAEHQHRDETWASAGVEAARAYQPRAAWESGRGSSPNVAL